MNNNDYEIQGQQYGINFDLVRIMGVLNVTPDSFSDGGLFLEQNTAINHGLKMVQQGADIIDIGGESSRPGAEPVPLHVELKRVIPVIEGMREKTDVLISIDTCKAKVAEEAIKAGASWVNDISALQSDPAMIEVIQNSNLPVVIMHMKGIPKTMQNNPSYDNVVVEINNFFSERIDFLQKKGIEKIILDPGIGFGKRLEDNLAILRHLFSFRKHGFPILVGTSRKSFIGDILDKSVTERESGTLASLIWSSINGAHILRTHSIESTVDALKIVNAILDNVKLN